MLLPNRRERLSTSATLLSITSLNSLTKLISFLNLSHNASALPSKHLNKLAWPLSPLAVSLPSSPGRSSQTLHSSNIPSTTPIAVPTVSLQ